MVAQVRALVFNEGIAGEEVYWRFDDVEIIGV